MSPEQTTYDVLIVGGGLVGASLAFALGQRGLRVGVVEAHRFGSNEQPSYDDRSIALAYGSKCIFASLGLWSALAESVTPIRTIHISNRGHFGFTRLRAEDVNVEALGYVVENRVIGRVFGQVLPSLQSLDLLMSARLTQVRATSSCVEATLITGQVERSVTARLLVAADGQDSTVRASLGIAVRRSEYNQSAIIANVTPTGFHDHTAYERFTDSGPLALLPLSDQRCSLVWTVSPTAVDVMLGWSDQEFLTHLGERFGRRLGSFIKVGRRRSYPLALVRATEHVRHRVALIGNAAHTLHPVAGQGFNLGIRDVAALAQLIADAHVVGDDVGGSAVLEAYAAWRKRDHNAVIGFTDTVARVFTNIWPPVVLARNAGLLAIDMLPPVKRLMMRRTMGLAGSLPRLARGLSL